MARLVVMPDDGGDIARGDEPGQAVVPAGPGRRAGHAHQAPEVNGLARCPLSDDGGDIPRLTASQVKRCGFRAVPRRNRRMDAGGGVRAPTSGPMPASPPVGPDDSAGCAGVAGRATSAMARTAGAAAGVRVPLSSRCAVAVMRFICSCPRGAGDADFGSRSVGQWVHYSAGLRARTLHSGSGKAGYGKTRPETGSAMHDSGSVPESCDQAGLLIDVGARISVSRGSSPNTRR